MAQTFETILNRFDGGIQNDPRVRAIGSAQVCKNFDVLTNRFKMSPYRDSTDADSASSTSQKQNFAVAYDGSEYALYSLGVKESAATAEVLRKDLGDDLGNTTWTAPAENQAPAGGVVFGTFVYYENQAEIYCIQTQYIDAFSPTGSSWDNQQADLGANPTTTAEGLVHSKDDKCYIPYNKIASKDGASAWTVAAVTLPAHFKITSICEYGNYIAIAATPKNGIGKTFVYLWNRDGTLTTFSESIDWGTGQLNVLEEVEGFLVGVSLYGGTTVRTRDRIVFRAYNGGTPVTFLELQADGSSSILNQSKQKVDERLLFSMEITKGGTNYIGVWSLALHGDTFVLVQERTPLNDTDLSGATDQMKGFIKVGDYLIQAYLDDSIYKLSITNDQAYYTASSVFHTNINPNIPTKYMSRKKQLVAVSMNYVSLPTDADAKLEYRVDGGSCVEIFTEATNSAINTEAVVDVNGAQFKEGREYEFRITSTDNAEITELKYKWALMDTLI